MISELFTNLLLALVFGATVGLERERNNPNDPHVGGIRTFSLIALLGALAGIFYQHNYHSLALLIIIGFKTKLSAIPAAITMAVAFFVVHAPDPFEEKELAFLYLIAFTAIALLGAGKFSVDGLSKKKR